MKKLILSTIVLLCASWSANAQPWGFGPKAGAVFSSVNGIDGASCRTGVVAGVFIDRMVNDWISIEADLLYSMNGFKVKPDSRIYGNDQTLKMRLNYVNMPLVAKFYLVRGLNLQLGAQFGYLVVGKEVANDTDHSMKDAINKYNVSFVSGLAYDFNFGLILEGRYNIGLTPVENQIGKVTNGSLQIVAGWRF
ncbi:MAG: PorT family protein [Rikenellaceae bacterium]|nr:PorT family protein [Rikenellaceae bacterium]